MKVTLYLAETINGFIAKENDDTPWSKAEFSAFYATVRRSGCIVLGKRTYNIMKAGGELKKCGNPFTVIVSKSMRKASGKNMSTAKSPKEALKTLKVNGFRNVIIGGGSRLATSFMRDRLVDEICLDVEPLAFGSGVPLFQGSDIDARLKLTKVSKISKNTVRLNYKVL